MSVNHTPPSTYILRELHDVTVPESVSWLPQTIGWKLLAVILVVILLVLLAKLVRRWWINRYRQEALISLSQLDIDDPQMPYQVFSVLKIVLVHLDPHHRSLHGAAFLRALEHYTSSTDKVVKSMPKDWLESLINPTVELCQEERAVLMNCATLWLKRHQNKPSVSRGGYE
ncbi:DUF4381 domain-containing protein [Vibrio panuliri]|uniref:DUF4381 domain-containing protein n=1 Tax=Vibrio panuliri TaxID=1381081 RepID=A0ABX3FLI9_9VIBR|nr:DUF4381 domain-containing protein [Vibrio panuliri]KAB1457223.1 DUF4381 domain-containing protein [Vibrio panuliri]OLQ92527.1 hypothetical protein BIY20_08595 [Vibrio panuliri]